MKVVPIRRGVAKTRVRVTQRARVGVRVGVRVGEMIRQRVIFMQS